MRARTLLAVLGGLAVASGPLVAPLAAQDAPGPGTVRTGASVEPDTVRVGEPFTIGVVATTPDAVRFPPLIDAGDGWEQLDIARIETGDGEARAYYRLVAWRAGELELPDLVIATGDGARRFRVRLPAPTVRSILPAGDETPELRGPRGPFDPGVPWLLWLALVVLLAVIAWWWWRRRRRGPEPAVVAEEEGSDLPSERARAAIVALRQEAEAGALAAPAFYDRLEDILRVYLADTRAWPPTRPVRNARELLRGDMRDLHRHAVFSRFGGVDAAGTRLVADADTSLDWLDGDAA